ncbi:MAG: hypothetical protein NT050_01360 [Verrucomicrobia bacterium]|jgi:hypothetical protein|nr:hypothetical protein [Verrucomicrobiota bacterium]
MIEDVLFSSAVHLLDTQNRDGGESVSRAATDVRTQNEFIQCDVEKLFMLTEALWTILKEKHGCTDAELVQRVQEIDLRDGKLDGKVAKVNPDCPKCGRKLMGKRPVCLYCGAEVARVDLQPFSR